MIVGSQCCRTIGNYIAGATSGELSLHAHIMHFILKFLLRLVLVIYEYTITLRHEIETLLWKRPWTLSSILFLSVRWVMLLDTLFGYSPSSPRVSLETLCICAIRSSQYCRSAYFSPCHVFTINSTTLSCIVLPRVLEVFDLVGILQITRKFSYCLQRLNIS